MVTINGTVGNDVSTAAWEGRNTLRVTRGTLSATYSSVKGIVFNGYDGNDSFINSTALPPSVIDGGEATTSSPAAAATTSSSAGTDRTPSTATKGTTR